MIAQQETQMLYKLGNHDGGEIERSPLLSQILKAHHHFSHTQGHHQDYPIFLSANGGEDWIQLASPNY